MDMLSNANPCCTPPASQVSGPAVEKSTTDSPCENHRDELRPKGFLAFPVPSMAFPCLRRWPPSVCWAQCIAQMYRELLLSVYSCAAFESFDRIWKSRRLR